MEDHKNVQFIEQLFYKQIQTLTKNTATESFELQHSDAWL